MIHFIGSTFHVVMGGVSIAAIARLQPMLFQTASASQHAAKA
jgi:hypothetical protein